MKELLYIATPHYNLFPSSYMVSYAHTRKALQDRYRIGISFCESALVHVNRNILMKNALRDKADYMMCIDSDIVWVPSDIEKLIATGKDVVSGVYPNRKPVCYNPTTYVPCLYRKLPEGNYESYHEAPKELSIVDAAGMGFMLLRKNVVEKMIESIPELGYPFDYIPAKEMNGKADKNSGLVGEDMCFCYRLKKAGFDVWCEPSVQVGHNVTRTVYQNEYPKEG